MTENSEFCRRVLICQNRTCRQQGAQKVLAIFQASPIPGVAVEGCGCLGQCGNGPMVLVEPEQIWYSRLRPDEVTAIIDRHLREGKPVAAMLYPKFHPVSK